LAFHGDSVASIASEYLSTITALLAVGTLILLQLVVADIAAILAKHAPGTPVPPDFSRFYVRAARAHANTNESVVIFLAAAVAGILTSASSYWLGLLSWSYVACRVLHSASYYANKQLPRSAAFGLSLVVLLAMLAVSGAAALG